MLTLIFDKGQKTEKTLEVNSYQERPIAGTLSGSYSIIVSIGAILPRIKGFAAGDYFETISAINSDGIELPISGEYNHISDFRCTYDDKTKQYSIFITINHEVTDHAG